MKMMRRTWCSLGWNLLLTAGTWLQVAGGITEARAAAGHSDSLLVSLAESHPRQSRQVNYANSNPSFTSGQSANQRAVYPFDYSTNGIARSYYPTNSYMGYPVYPRPSGVGYSVPNGATPVQEMSRSYSPSYSSSGINTGPYTAYNYPSYTSTYNAAPSGSSSSPSSYSPILASRSLYAQPSLRANAPYGYPTNSYYPNRDNRGSYALSYRSADPSDPEDPDTDSSSRSQFASLQAMSPRFQAAPTTQTASVQSVPNAAAFTGVASQMSSLPAGQLAAFSGRGLGGGSTSGYGVGNSYASSVPAGATPTGSSGYAQSSPNTVSGSLYNANYAQPSFYGKSPSYGGGGGGGGGGGAISPALLYPFFLYYPVQYGYDQGEQSVMPTGGYFPLIGYKRRYGYRNGPYYGYGIYVDYPPYFGFGKVKDGFGSDPEADAMAAVALEQGSGASESLNSGAGAASGYGQQGSSGYAGNQGGGSSGYGNGQAGYGGTSTANGYAPAVSGYNSGTGSNPSAYSNLGSSYSPASYQAGMQYPSQRSLPSLPSGYSAVPSSPATGQASQYAASPQYSAASRSYLPVSAAVASPTYYPSQGQNTMLYVAPQYGSILSTSG